MDPSWEEREIIGAKLGVVKCSHCLRLCPYCPRLLAVRPDLAWVPPEGYLEESHPESNDPSLFQKIVNLSRAVTQHVAAGLQHTDEETVKYRLEICHTCDRFNPTHSTCRVCGCNMTIKAKWAEQRCPINKW